MQYFYLQARLPGAGSDRPERPRPYGGVGAKPYIGIGMALDGLTKQHILFWQLCCLDASSSVHASGGSESQLCEFSLLIGKLQAVIQM